MLILNFKLYNLLKMGILHVNYSSLKWGILPTRRLVDEDNSQEQEQESGIDTPKTEVESTDNEKTDLVNSDEHSVADSFELEYRDEKDRKWWKFFDEYEYRINKKKRKEHKWFKWFNEDDTPEERRVIMKLDILLTFYSMMAYWVKYLDQTNLTNAYVGGLQEGIGMKGNDFVNTQVMFNVGNIVFQIPFMYVLYAAPMNYVLPSLDICWSIFTICLSEVKNVHHLKALRFFVGAFEAPSYLAYQWLFGSWYKVDEIARRSMIYYFGQYLGVLTSGLLSGSIERTLDQVHGKAAWQWIFIIDGCISLAVGFIGFYMLPGTPTDCYSIFLTDDDIRIARKRLISNQTQAKKKEFNVLKSFINVDTWKSILGSWHIYILAFWNMFCWNNSNASSGSYALWLKSLKDSNGNVRYNKGELQDYTALTPGLGLVWLFITCTFADLFHCRWQAILFSQVFNITGNILLAVWDIPERSKWFAFCMQYFGWAMAPVLYSWQNDICRKDIKKRTVTLVFMNMLAQASTAWMAVIVWKTVDQPRYMKGFTFTACSAFTLCLWTFVVLYFYKRQERQQAKENGIVVYNSKLDPDFVVPQHSTNINSEKQ